ncbi:hypothetical protein DQ400_01230 [Vreelandella sulfidaeris]|uniref:diguanylate cyclase n=1 Tax=Vreelandella sulfidaeris TaxID=115553 RepID=A0A365TTF3_9GAMM|nr:GGDEF domain-containing protein [Halomonas sulfidaeris]RBI69345.1 hypothetical protein DQ400_01230 [Halomonas sulfidaeris]
MIMPMRHSPDFLSYFSDDAGSMLQILWDFFPTPMMVVRFEGQDNFVVEALNPSQQAALSSQHVYVGNHLADMFPASFRAELIANCARCMKKKVPVRYEIAGGCINSERYQSDCQVLLMPINNYQGIATHLLCIVHHSSLGGCSEIVNFSEQELERRVMERTNELTSINRQLTYLATHDWLTDAYNRRHLLELATTEFKRASRYGLSLGLLMLDIDHFKSLNDEQGHSAGDQALKTVARAMRETIRDCDLLGRYGGDEFIIVFPETDIQGARAIAERLSSKLKDANLSVSVGLTTLERNDQMIDNLINRADRLLLNAKRNGRNRIESASLTLIN